MRVIRAACPYCVSKSQEVQIGVDVDVDVDVDVAFVVAARASGLFISRRAFTGTKTLLMRQGRF